MFNIIPLPYKIAAFVFIIIAVFGAGYMRGNARAEAEIAAFAAEANAKVAELERKNTEVTNTVITKYVDKVRVVKEREYVYLNAAQSAVPSQFIISDGWLYLHDTSARGDNADTSRASDATPSGIKDNQALGTITQNYSTCRENAQQLASLQQWILDMQAQVNNNKK